jgi:hypothetical protein
MNGKVMHLVPINQHSQCCCMNSTAFTVFSPFASHGQGHVCPFKCFLPNCAEFTTQIRGNCRVKIQGDWLFFLENGRYNSLGILNKHSKRKIIHSKAVRERESGFLLPAFLSSCKQTARSSKTLSGYSRLAS